MQDERNARVSEIDDGRTRHTYPGNAAGLA
jgi:hypothetical protein